jgi:hypothetical protein
MPVLASEFTAVFSILLIFFVSHMYNSLSCDDVARISTRLQAGRSAVRIPLGKKMLFLQNRPFLGPTEPPGTGGGGVLSRVKRSEHEVIHSPPSSAAVKNEWSSNLLHQYAFMAFTGTILLSIFIILLSSSITGFGTVFVYDVSCWPTCRFHNVHRWIYRDISNDDSLLTRPSTSSCHSTLVCH